MSVLSLALLAGLVAYHVIRWLGFRPRQEVAVAESMAEPGWPSVSMIVPAWNAAASIGPFMSAFDDIAYPRKELVLCAGGEDGSYEIALVHARADVKVIRQDAGDGKQGALAKGFAVSFGDIIYLTDVDCLPDSASLARLVRPIVERQEAVVTGSCRPLASQYDVGAVTIHWATMRKAAGLEARHVDGLVGANAAVTRAALKAIGGFCFDAPTGTDYRLAQELFGHGYRIWFEPGSEIQTEFAWPLGNYVRQSARWLRNVVMFAERPRQDREYNRVVISLALPFVLLLLVAASLATRNPAGVVLTGAALLHGTLNRLRHAREMLPPEYFGRSLVSGSVINLLGTLGAGVYAAVTLLTPTLRRRW